MDLLLKAARDGDLEKFKKLLSSDGESLSVETVQGNTVLHQAAKFGRLNIAKETIERNRSLILRPNYKGETAAHVAARAGYVEIVKLLVKEFPGARIASTRDKHGNTPLHGAVRNNRKAVYRELFREDKMSLTLVNDMGESPLSIAIDKKWTSLANEIIADNKETLNFTGPNGYTPLHLAVIRRDSDVIDKILEIDGGRHVSWKQDHSKRSALHYAAAKGEHKAVKLLLKNNPSLANLADSKGKRPIHMAGQRAKACVVRELLSALPDSVELVDNRKQNILHIAAKHGNVDVVSLIMSLEKEMEEILNSQDVDGNTPLHLAARHFHSNVVHKLSQNHMVEIRMLNKKGLSALALVQTTKTGDMEFQKHLTLKALKTVYRKRKVETDETIGQDMEVGSTKPPIIEEVSSKRIKEMANTLTVVATLIATFTFTAAFTLPGGFKQDGPYEGTATDLIRKASFKAFIITDTIAVTSSISAAVILFWSSSYRDNESFLDALPIAITLTWLSLLAMAGAFVTGLFAMLSTRLWLAITVCFIGCLPPAVLYVFAPLVILVSERWFVSTLSSNSNVFENNPFVFVARIIKMRC